MPLRFTLIALGAAFALAPTATAQMPVARSFPFRFDGHIYVPTLLGESGPALLVLDPISGMILDRTSANRRGIPLLGSTAVGNRGTVRATGAGAAQHEVTFARDLSAKVGDFTISRPVVAAIPLDSMMSGSFDHRVDGLLGLDAFASYILKLDFLRQIATVFDSAGFTAPANAVSLPFEALPGGKPVIRISITLPGGKRVSLRAVADIGMEAPIRISTRVTDSLNLVSAFPNALPDNSFTGLGGTLASLMVRIPTVSFGTTDLHGVVAALARETQGADANPPFDVFLGLELFRRFDTYFDWPRRTMYLVPNSAVAEPFVYAPLGVDIAASDERRLLSVAAVTSNSAASRAGLQAGDIIVRVGTEDTEGWTRYQFERAVVASLGRPLALQVRRGQQMMTLSLTARSQLPN